MDRTCLFYRLTIENIGIENTNIEFMKKMRLLKNDQSFFVSIVQADTMSNTIESIDDCYLLISQKKTQTDAAKRERE